MRITPNPFIDFVYGFKSFIPKNLNDLRGYFPYFHRNVKAKQFSIRHHIYSQGECYQIKIEKKHIFRSKDEIYL
jgi:hypothetical protein